MIQTIASLAIGIMWLAIHMITGIDATLITGSIFIATSFICSVIAKADKNRTLEITVKRESEDNPTISDLSARMAGVDPKPESKARTQDNPIVYRDYPINP